MFGLIGNGETCALVSCFASIDWLCVPRFDSPTLFARALDYQRGGYLGLTVLDGRNPRPFPRGQHRYLPGTNVLESFHEFGGRRIRVTDFMVPGRPRLDASVLMVPLSGMLPVRHPRVQSTLRTLSRELEFGGLLCRFEEESGAFLLTSLGWAEALALQRKTGPAQKILELFCGRSGALAKASNSARGR